MVHSQKYLESRDIGPMLKKAGILTEAQLSHASGQANHQQCSLTEVLVQQKMLTQETIERLLKARLALHDSKIFSLARGRVSSGRKTEADFVGYTIAVDVNSVLFRGLLQQLQGVIGIHQHGQVQSHVLRETYENWMHEQRAAFLVQRGVSIDFNEQELKLWESMASGKKTLHEIVQQSPFKKEETHAFLIALRRLGKVQFSKQSQSNVLEELQREITVFYNDFLKSDPFSQLGVHWTHRPSGFAEAFQKRKATIEKMRNTSLPKEFSQKLHEMVQILQENLKVLEISTERRALRARLADRPQIEHAAVMLFQQAQMLIMRESYRDAKECLEVCSDLDPGNKTYQELLQRVGVLGK
jgi:hypothetical protein